MSVFFLRRIMTIKESLLQMFMSTNSDDFTDDEVKQQLHSETIYNLLPYKNFHNKQVEKLDEDTNIKKLIVLRIFSAELWEEICQSEYAHDKEFERRINVIGKAYTRMQICLDENICLLEKGYGITMVSNQRLMLECLALSKYIWEKGEEEAIRFQDHADAQEMKIAGINPNKLFKNKYKKDFYLPNGWISDKKIKSIRQMVDSLEWTEYKKMYKFSSEFVHASPESIEIVSKLNRNLATNYLAYFPLGFEHQIELNVYLIQDFTKLIINSFVKPETRKLDLFLLNAIVKWM